MESVILTGAIIAVVKALRDAAIKDYTALVVVAVSGVIGGLATYTNLPGVPDTNFIGGLLIGFAASGAVTVATRVSGRS